MLHDPEIPQSIEAEEAVLGSILLDPHAAIKVANGLRAQDFHREKNGWIYQAMCVLSKRGTPPDFLTVCDELERHSRLEECGGREYLTALLTAVPTSAHVRHYAEIVREMATRRALIRVAGAVAAHAYDLTLPMPEVLSQSKSELAGIHTSDLTVATMSQQAGGYITRQVANGGKGSIMRTGITAFDQAVKLHRGELLIIDGRPGMAKSSLAVTLALHLAKDLGIPTGFCSIEMSSDVLVSRMICQTAGVSSSDLERYLDSLRTPETPVNPQLAGRIDAALSTLATVPIFINDRGIQTLATISDFASTVALEHGVKALIVDHLQIVTTTGTASNRNSEIGDITRTLRGLAKDLDMWLIILSQLNRAVETRPMVNGRVPYKLSDLRESGNIEQDADVVVFVDRAHPANQQSFPLVMSPRGPAEPAFLVVAKNRNGALADVPVLFVPHQAAFVDAESEQDGQEGGIA